MWLSKHSWTSLYTWKLVKCWPIMGTLKQKKVYRHDHHLHIPGVPLHLQSLAVDLRVILFTFLRGSNSWRFILEAADVAALGALQRNDNWPWDVTVWRMLDKQSRSNYTQLLLQMKRIKANESHTGQRRGCLMKREREGDRGMLEQFCDLITMSKKK